MNAYDTTTVPLGDLQGAGGLKFRRKGGVVQLFINSSIISPGLQYGTDYKFTVPSGFRPVAELTSYFVQNGSVLMFINISASGSGYIRLPTSGDRYTGWIYQEFTYIAE